MRLEPADGLPVPGEPGLFWLGQAGFWIETGRHRILIDPYLSDSLAKKYKGKKHPHIRMMPPPIAIADLPRPDIVLTTHAHTDHLDPETLGALHRRFPDLPFVVPAAHQELAAERIGNNATLFLANVGEDLKPLPGLSLRVFPAAHEDLKRDAGGQHLFLGYGVSVGDLRVYHSGDSVPFEGLEQLLKAFEPQILLLPVNGRDSKRLADGIPGNFTLKEALKLAGPFEFLIPHHFGMFEFNTIDPVEIDIAAAQICGRPKTIRPMPGVGVRIVQAEGETSEPTQRGTKRKPS